MEVSDEQIAEFCLITEAEPSIAKYYLDAASGDLDVAVGLFMESSATPNIDTNAVRKPIQPRMSTLTEESTSNWPLERENLNIFDRRHSPIAATSTITEQSIFGRRSGTLASGEQDNETGTRQRLAYLFRAPTEIMFTGGFEEAKRVARRPFEEKQFRYLLVTIHIPTEFFCQAMNRDVWNDTFVQQIIEQNFIFLQFTENTAETDRFVSNYTIDVTHIPYVAIIDPRTGEKVREWMDKKWTSNELVETLLEFISSHESVDNDGANESPNIPEFVEESQTTIPSQMDETQSIPPRKKSQNAPLDPEPEASDPNATLIQFRLPDGNKLRRRFLINAPISSLFDFLNSTQYSLPHSYKLCSTLHNFTIDDNRTLSEGNLKNVSLTIVDDLADQK